ncbi:isatin hydrolase-like [Liolophura sinensis]|uniref:isatin hydrolase-like n=1 Tax=Liolophura sinensis TaxID=3198878 RepID=UPI00315852DE
MVDIFRYESNSFSMAEHGGTHLDAPAHFWKGGWRVHDIPLTRFIGPGVVIDISARAQQNPDAQVEVADLLKWEEDHGKIPERAMVLMNSGWSQRWPNKTLVFGSRTPDDSSTFHFPGFSPKASQWLVDNRKHINAIGVDTPSVDYGQSRDFETHVITAGASLVCLENIAHLDKIPVKGATINAIPMKIRDGSGAPVRMFAIMNNVNAAQDVHFAKISFLVILVAITFT